MISHPHLNTTLKDQIRRVCDELRGRLRAGEDCRAEDMLRANPEMAFHPAMVLEVVCAEYETRRELGQQLILEEWYVRFPECREHLERQFEKGSVADCQCPACSARRQSEAAEIESPTRLEMGSPSQAVTTWDGHRAGGPAKSGSPPERRLGRYQLEEEIGRGGMGVVYRAFDSTLGRTVALKVIRAGLLAEDQEVERFLREARAAAQLDHPNIVPLYEIGGADGHYFFTMPLLTGGSLSRNLAGYQGKPEVSAAILEKVARAVHHAHERGILHRDLKLANILLNAQGDPLVADFGLAKFAAGEGTLTQEGQVVGTPAYMAPEQALGHHDRVGPASDIWSLGIMLYELLAGSRPFQIRTQSEAALVLPVADPPSLRMRGSVHADLEKITAKCLEKEPAHRYATAAALANDLRAWLENKPIQARPSGLWRKTLRKLRRNKGVVAALTCFTAFLIVLLILLLKGADQEAPPSVRPSLQVAEEDWKVIQKDLAHDRKVILVGATGGPRWSEPWMGKKALTVKSSGDLPWQLETWSFEEPAVVQFLPDSPSCHSYVFRAEIRHDAGVINGDVGLCFLTFAGDTPGGKEYYTCVLVFDECGPFDAKLDAEGRRWIRPAVILRRYCSNQTPALRQHYLKLSKPVPAEKGRWRRLEVKVTLTEVSVRWEGQLIHKFNYHSLKSTGRKLLGLENWGVPGGPLPGIGPDAPNPQVAAGPLDLRPTLGICLSQGAASIQNVEIVPNPK